MIPKILHRVWISYDGKSYNEVLNDRCINAIKMQNECCKDFIIIEWGTPEHVRYYADKYPMFKKFYYDVKNLAFCSDIIRLDVLYRFGGIYLDTDVEVFQPLNNEKLLNSRFFIGKECVESPIENRHCAIDGHLVSNAIIGAEANNKIIKSFLDVVTFNSHGQNYIKPCDIDAPMNKLSLFCRGQKHKEVETFDELHKVDIDEYIPIFKPCNIDRANDPSNTCDLKLFDHFYNFSWHKFL